MQLQINIRKVHPASNRTTTATTSPEFRIEIPQMPGGLRIDAHLRGSAAVAELYRITSAQAPGPTAFESRGGKNEQRQKRPTWQR